MARKGLSAWLFRTVRERVWIWIWSRRSPVVMTATYIATSTLHTCSTEHPNLFRICRFYDPLRQCAVATVDLDVVGACRWRLRLVGLRAAGYRSQSSGQNPSQDALISSSFRSPDVMDWSQVSSLNMGDARIRFAHGLCTSGGV